MPEKGRPKRYSVAIRKLGERSEDARLVQAFALNPTGAVTKLAEKGKLDPRTEEVIGIEEV